MGLYDNKPCPCGSGLERSPLFDAAGIFCTFTCPKCENKKRAKYDPAVFDGRSTYAATGEEMDVGRYPGEDY